MKHIKNLLPFFLIVLFFCLPVLVQAQPEDNGGDPAPQDTPIDGGLSVLLAAGAAYGVKRMRKGAHPTSRKEEE